MPFKGDAPAIFPAERQDAVIALPDRRSNPFVRSRSRKNFDRRAARRIGLHALTFVHADGEVLPGSLRDISDAGARLEISGIKSQQYQAFNIAIPLLRHQQISCEVSWSQNGGHMHCLCGVRFVGLTHRDRNQLRKRIMLDESLLLAYAAELLWQAGDESLGEEIKSFFLIDVRRSLERLIDIETMIEAGERDDEVLHALKETLDGFLDSSHELEMSLNDAALARQVKQRVRALMGYFLYQSNIFRMAFIKPRGYPGDYEIIEAAYNNRAFSPCLGKFLDLYSLQLPYTVAVRGRKDMMRDMLHRFINCSAAERLNILNLASGACREIRELCALPIVFRGAINIMCIDQDGQAIEYARQKLDRIRTDNVHINMIQGNILRLESLDVGPDNGLDLIYSIGVADYLHDRMLLKLFGDCYRKLKPQGTLVVAHKAKEDKWPLGFNWYGDWNFVARSVNDLVQLMQRAIGEDNIAVTTEWEQSGVIFFIIVTKLR